MNTYKIRILDKEYEAEAGKTLLSFLNSQGIKQDAPCGGKGQCKKCSVIVNNKEMLACQTIIDSDLNVQLKDDVQDNILTDSFYADTTTDKQYNYAFVYDIGTTTIVCHIVNCISNTILSTSSCLNPQISYGADVISRIQYIVNNNSNELQSITLKALQELANENLNKTGLNIEDIQIASIVGNTAMHHILLGIDPSTLIIPPYMPAVFNAIEDDLSALFPKLKLKTVRILPNIAGFVGADTVGCLVATRFNKKDKYTLLIDIGTNGEMALGNKDGFTVCSTAAGPAFEGAKISMGMRGANGAIDHVYVNEGKIKCHVIGEKEAIGICGSGLLDAISCMLDIGIIDESGKIQNNDCYQIPETNIVITQQDVREVQLAKAAIRAGIELLAKHRNINTDNINEVLLAGAFGNYLNPASACNIGLIPPTLLSRIRVIGNAACEGSRLCAVNSEEFEYSKDIAKKADFLELASRTEFQDLFVDSLLFEESNE